MNGESRSTRHGYQYVVMRCVPRVDREEFVNIGVVVYSQAEDFLCVASNVVDARLTSLFPDLDVEAVHTAIQAIEAVCCGESPLASSGLVSLGKRFGWLAAPKSTVVQPGP
ncbi:MAG: hypothetical protein QOH56_3953, partial [Pseudonocardiales bacterium]|nr:hypothetical protein [Pseudonocardiales bacterium]